VKKYNGVLVVAYVIMQNDAHMINIWTMRGSRRLGVVELDR
jgi:hypothetical protein